MTDDPWRPPDPNSPPPQAPLPPPAAGYPPPPGYGPPAAYAPPPGYGPPSPYGAPNPYGPPPAYGPPGQGGFNPYQAPLPQRGGIKRLVWILSTAGVLALGGCGALIVYGINSISKNADAVNAFLRNVRDKQFDAAYNRLCPDTKAGETNADFDQMLQAADAADRGVVSFDITSSFTTTSTGYGTTRTASGTVDLADGTSKTITFGLEKNSGSLCVMSGWGALD